MKKRMTLTAYVLISLTGSVYAQEVPINDVLPIMKTDKTTEQPSNVWFLLDDSGSMGELVSFDRYVAYPLPLQPNGVSFPEPGDGIRYLDPFITYARDGNFANFRAARDSYCNGYRGTVRTNCKRYRSYYRTRMLSLKSSFSVAMNGLGVDKKIRWGFDSLWRNNGVSRQILPKDIQTTRQELYKKVFQMGPNRGTPLRKLFASAISDIRAMASATPRDGEYHPDLFDMNRGFDDKTNPKLSCRRNHVLLLTDGRWNGNFYYDRDPSFSSNVLNGTLLRGFNTHDSDYTRGEVILPDGMKYDAYAPYKPSRFIGSRTSRPSFYIGGRWVTRPMTGGPRDKVITIADIAFAGWATDINSDENDNTLLMRREPYPVHNNSTSQYYENTRVSGSGTIPTTLMAKGRQPITEGQYWHPYNDPASWQHFNTHTVTFGLGATNINVNPPKTQQEAIVNYRNPFDIGGYIYGSRGNNGFAASANDFSGSAIVDDMARAAVAGRGEFHNVRTPQGLTAAFKSIFNSIDRDNGGSSSVSRGSAAVVASGSVGSQQLLFSSHFDPRTFAGEVVALPVFDGTQSPSDCWVEPQLSQYTDSNGDVLPSVGAGTFCNNRNGSNAWKASKSMNDTNFTSRNVVTSVLKKIGSDEIDSLDDYKEQVAKGEVFKLEAAEFQFNNLKEYRKRTSKGVLDQQYYIDYIRGDSRKEVRNGGSLRNRVKSEEEPNAGWLLGAVSRSAPVFVGRTPAIASDHFVLKDDAALSAYVDFKKLSRPDMVYFGSNDGMLHALDATSNGAKTGREVFSYIPHLLFDKLPKVTKDGEYNSFVDGKLTVELTYEKEGKSRSDWHLRLVSGLGPGGKGLFSLDVSEAMRDANEFLKAKPWEYSEKDSQSYNAKNNKPGKSNVGNILARPGIIQVNNTSDTSDSGWVVAVGNGYNAESNKAALILLDAFTGEIIQELVLDTSKNSTSHKHYIDNSRTNGLGPLFFLSYEGKLPRRKYQIDRAYAGDLQGNLWVFDFSGLDIKECRAAKTKKEKEKHCVKVASKQFDSDNIIPLFTAVDKNGKRQPITVAPLVEEHPTGFGYLVHFGTGALFDRVDLSLFDKDDPDTPIVNSIYALWDDWVPFGVGSGSGLETPKVKPITFNRNNESALRELKWNKRIVQNSDGQPIEVRTIARDDKDKSVKTTWALGAANLDPGGHKKKRGWFIDLDPRERAWQRPFVAFGESSVRSVSYVTTTYPDKDNDIALPSCTTSTEAPFSWTIAFDPDDGSQLLSGSGTIDTNSDGKVCLSCAKTNSNGLTGDPIKDGLGSGTPTPPTGMKYPKATLSAPQSAVTPPGQGLSSCPGLMKVSTNVDDKNDKQSVACRPLLPSSWQELK